MIRSGEQLLFEAAIVRGAAEARAAAWAELLRPFTELSRQVGIGLSAAAESLGAAMAHYNKALSLAATRLGGRK